MKKIITILMVSAMILTLFTFVGCGEDEPATLKLGLGVSTSEVTASDATEEKAGKGTVTATAAAVLVDDEGKIVKVFIDCAENEVSYKANGEAVANTEFKSKYEKGEAYGMKAYAGAAKEWYEQADTFCALIVGKTVAEVKALVVNGTATDEVINAGCTMDVSDFVIAVEKAVANATASNATKDDTLKLGVSTTQTTANATDEKNGSNEVSTTFFAAAVNAEGKVAAASSDCVEVEFTFDVTGKSKYDATKPVLSKKEQGDDYGMKAYAGAAKEWYEQAAAFDAACIGKTASEIAGLMGADYKGNADLQAAGCTIYVSDFVKAASKIG